MLFYSEMGYSKGCTAFFQFVLADFSTGIFFSGNVLRQLTEEKRLDKIHMSGEVRPEKSGWNRTLPCGGVFLWGKG